MKALTGHFPVLILFEKTSDLKVEYRMRASEKDLPVSQFFLN